MTSVNYWELFVVFFQISIGKLYKSLYTNFGMVYKKKHPYSNSIDNDKGV